MRSARGRGSRLRWSSPRSPRRSSTRTGERSRRSTGAQSRREMRVALVAQRPNQTNLALAARSWNGRPIELIERQRELPDIDVPAVVKPRFGSWGREVTLCRDRRELERTVERLVFRPWFRTGGAIAQELIPPLGHDLRVIVAGGTVVGAGRRDAAPGE